MRKGILDVSVYEHHENEFMIGCLSSLAASAIWLIVATFIKLPISGTHSIVGATIGFTLVARGTSGVHWDKLGTIGNFLLIILIIVLTAVWTLQFLYSGFVVHFTST